MGYNIHSCSDFKKKLMQLIKAEWITFKENLNVSANPLSNLVSGSGSVNALEVECPGNLKELMTTIGCEKGSIYSRGCP
jgi:hypothetical protein